MAINPLFCNPDDFLPAHAERENKAQWLTALPEHLSKVTSLDDPLLDKLYEPDTLAYLSTLDDMTRQRIKATLKGIKGFSITSLEKAIKATPKPEKAANTHTEPDYQQIIEACVEDLNKTYANVLLGSVQRIMKRIPSHLSESGQVEYKYLAKDDFIAIHANDLITVGSNKDGVRIQRNKAKVWLTHPKCRVYRDGVIFKPLPLNAPPLKNSVFNLWEGFAVKPVKGDWSLFDRHIREVICNNYQPLIDYFYDWVAHKIQHPDYVGGSVFVVKGLKGTGKGLVGNFLASIWGSHSLQISNGLHLTGRFNGHLAKVCFLFSDEAFFAGDKQAESVLKKLVTDSKIAIESKGIDAKETTNYLQIFMAANDDWVVPVSADDRRYCVTEARDCYKGNTAYFDALAQHCNDTRVKSAFLYDMLQRDVSTWRAGNIPETEALRDQRMQSLQTDSVKAWLVDYFGDGWEAHEEAVDVEGYTIYEMKNIEHAKSYLYFTCRETTNRLYDRYLEWCHKHRKSEFKIDSSIKSFGKKLTSAFKPYRTNKERGFYFGESINEARLSLMRAFRITLELEDPDILHQQAARYEAVKWLKANPRRV